MLKTACAYPNEVSIPFGGSITAKIRDKNHQKLTLILIKFGITMKRNPNNETPRICKLQGCKELTMDKTQKDEVSVTCSSQLMKQKLTQRLLTRDSLPANNNKMNYCSQ